MSEKEIIQKAIAHNGKMLQTIVAIEEMAELQKELSKAIRGEADKRHITEEYADVLIMLEQIKLIYDLDEKDINGWKRFKLRRLRERIECNGKRRE